MQLWRVQSGRRVRPFDDAVEDALLFPSCLAEAQEELCRRRAIELVDVADPSAQEIGPGLVQFDDAFANGPALDHLAREGRGGGLIALAQGDDPLGRYIPPLDDDGALDGGDAAIGLFWLDRPLRADSARSLWHTLCAEARSLRLPAAAVEVERLPGFPGVRPTLEIPRGRAVAARVRYWPHILWLNQALAYAPWGPQTRGRGENEIAPGARVHPTAHLERARIGPHSVVEPHATIIDSAIGAHCHIGDHTVLIGSAIGHHCHTLTDSYFRRVVSYPDCTLSSMGLEEVLVGRGVFLTAAVIFFNTVQGEPARVDIDGRAIETGRARLGGCVGHRAILGARAIFLPGRAVENGYTVVMRPEEGVGRIDPSLADGRPACWHQGKLLGLEEVAPGYSPPELESPPATSAAEADPAAALSAATRSTTGG